MRRPLLLNGFMATGKSTVGRKLADIARRDFIDLDRRIEVAAGRSIAELFVQLGEPGFREVERRALAEVLDRSSGAPAVVALGGGALAQRETRLDALDRAVVVTLEATPDEILRRAQGESRPLLAGPDRAERARELLSARAVGYAEAHGRLSTDSRSAEAVANDALDIWQSDPLVVAAGERSYAVEVGADLLKSRTLRAVGRPSKLIVVSDQTVWALHGTTLRQALGELPFTVVELTPGEEHKHIASVEHIWRAALAAGADRRSRVLGFGGGVVTDIAGFAAATYMRGISWIGMPTTLLAMVDASVGGKTGVDLLAAKNAVGAFWQPGRVVCDVDLLDTESTRGLRSALAEVVKTAIIGDPALLDVLEADPERALARDRAHLAEVVRGSIRVKARIVSRDERESGVRALLNLGHTVGHALEAVGGYARLAHGEAVSLGLVAALRIGTTLGLTPQALTTRIEALLARLGLPHDIASEPLDDALELIGHDKKRAGQQIRFVVAREAGQVETIDLGLDELQRMAGSLKRKPGSA
jgi:shikimate kinase/3-dehydroquinate synthase